jgi:hypothetical protein
VRRDRVSVLAVARPAHGWLATVVRYLLRVIQVSVPASQNVSKSQPIQSSEHDKYDAEGGTCAASHCSCQPLDTTNPRLTSTHRGTSRARTCPLPAPGSPVVASVACSSRTKRASSRGCGLPGALAAAAPMAASSAAALVTTSTACSTCWLVAGSGSGSASLAGQLAHAAWCREARTSALLQHTGAGEDNGIDHHKELAEISLRFHIFAIPLSPPAAVCDM